MWWNHSSVNQSPFFGISIYFDIDIYLYLFINVYWEGTLHSYVFDAGRGGTPIMEVTRMKGSKDPCFQRCCHPMTPCFCWSSLLSPKDPTFFWWNVDSLIALTQRPRIFCIRLPQGSYFLFQFHRHIDHFCHFRCLFFCKFLLLKYSLKDQN